MPFAKDWMRRAYLIGKNDGTEQDLQELYEEFRKTYHKMGKK